MEGAPFLGPIEILMELGICPLIFAMVSTNDKKIAVSMVVNVAVRSTVQMKGIYILPTRERRSSSIPRDALPMITWMNFYWKFTSNNP